MNTAQDVVHHLLAATGGGAQDGEHQAVRHAAIQGCREVMMCRQWLWHTKTNLFITLQAQTTADVTQGSNQVTVASATEFVPGRLVEFASGHFPNPVRIVSVSGNTVTLTSQASSSGTGIVARPQTFYDLPADLRDIDCPVTDAVGTLHCYMAPEEWLRLEVNMNGSGAPYYYTIMRSDVNPDRYQLRFVGVPTDGTPVYYTYRYLPKMLKYMGYERISRQGTVAAAGTSVTGSDTMFQSDHVGSVIRFGTPTSEPDPIGSLMPFIAERRIVGVSSGTAMTLDSAYTAPALTKYAITDVLDASPQMYTAILSAAEMWYARVAGRSPDGFAQASASFNRDLRIAMEADTVRPVSGFPNGVAFPTPRSAGWKSHSLGDVD